MSYMLDRPAPSMTSSAFGRQYGGSPAPPRSVSSGVGDTTGSSSYTDDESEFFDFDLWDKNTRGVGTDATTPSSIPPEESLAPSPPLLGPGSSIATPPSHGEDVPMLDVDSHETQPPHVWPGISGPHPPRDGAIHFEQSTETQRGMSRPPSSPNSSDMPFLGQSQAILPPGQKKTRTVKNPVETSQVRNIKACYCCKISKSKCDTALVCEQCNKGPLPEQACIRKTLCETLGSAYARWNWNDADILLPGRAQFVEDHPLRLLISLSDSVDGPFLDLVAHPFNLPNQKDRGILRWGIIRDRSPGLEGMICEWMKSQILNEKSTGFEAQIDKLLCLSVSRQEALSQTEGHTQAWMTLLRELLEMKCMLKIWSCKQLFFALKRGSPPIPFDPRLASIQDSLRVLAAEKISELERTVVKQIQENFVLKKDTAKEPGASPTKRASFDGIRWLVLWQMILIYRKSLGWMLEQQQTNAAPIPIAVAGIEKRHNFRETTKQLLNAITITYSAFFHKKKVQKLKAAGTHEFSKDPETQEAFARAWQGLPEFFEQVRGQVAPTDELFKAYIVENEADILTKGINTRK